MMIHVYHDNDARLTLCIQQTGQSQLLLCHVKRIVEVGYVLSWSQSTVVYQVGSVGVSVGRGL